MTFSATLLTLALAPFVSYIAAKPAAIIVQSSYMRRLEAVFYCCVGS